MVGPRTLVRKVQYPRFNSLPLRCRYATASFPLAPVAAGWLGREANGTCGLYTFHWDAPATPCAGARDFSVLRQMSFILTTIAMNCGGAHNVRNTTTLQLAASSRSVALP